MQKYNAIIIDDEPMARDILESHLSKIDQITVVAQCKNAAEGFSALSTYDVNLIFLDINMPEVSGMQFARAIHGDTKIIFTTAYRDYAIEGFELQVVDYLLKPISLQRLMKALQKFYSEEKQHTNVPVTLSETIVTRETLFTALEKLPPTLFLRTHRSYAVAIAKIDSYTNEHLVLDKKIIPISRSFRESVLQRLEAVK